jgi:hypothetical protein
MKNIHDPWILVCSYSHGVEEDESAYIRIGTEEEIIAAYDQTVVDDEYSSIMVGKLTHIASASFDFEEFDPPKNAVKVIKVSESAFAEG